MKLLIQAIVFVICSCLNAYAAPFFEDLGYALGILVFGNQDGGAIMCGLLAGALAVLVYGAGFVVAKRIRERKMDGTMRTAPGVKQMIFSLLMFLVDAAITDTAEGMAPIFGSGNLVVPVSGSQFLHDLFSLMAFHWIGVLGLVSLIYGLVAFCRRQPVYSKFAESVTATPSKSKTRFCKLCGDPIDPVTRKCTGCGKQYFRPPTFAGNRWLAVATAVSCAISLLLLFALLEKSSQIDVFRATIADQERTIDDLEMTIADKSEVADYLKQENRDMRKEILFYDNHVVLIGDDGTKKYHKYDCPYLDMSEGFYAYNTENAKAQGYKPCSHCCD